MEEQEREKTKEQELNYRELVRSTISSEAHFVLNKKLVKILGAEPSVFLSDLLSKERYFNEKNQLTEDGWFFNTQKNRKEDTGIPYHHQTAIVRALCSIGLMEERKQGLPKKQYFKINHKMIALFCGTPKDDLDKYKTRFYTYLKGAFSYNNKCKGNKISFLRKDTSLTDVKEVLSLRKDKSDSSNRLNRRPSDKNINTDIDTLISKNINTDIPTNEKNLTNNDTPIKGSLIPSEIEISSAAPTPSPLKNVFLTKELHPPQSPKKVVTLKVPPNVQEIFDYWTEQDLRMPKEETKSYNRCIRDVKDLLNGKLFAGEVYSIEQLKDSITYFSFTALDPDFEPGDLAIKKKLSKMSIAEFIHSFNGFSYFKKSLTEKPTPLKCKEVVEDKYPTITGIIKRFYREEVVGGAKIEFSQKDENCFRAGAIKTKAFYERNIRKFNPYMRIQDDKLAHWLIEAIKVDVNDDVRKITPGWFSSNQTFNHRFPAYLYSQAILQGCEDRYNNSENFQ